MYENSKPTTHLVKEVIQWVVSILLAVVIATLLRGFVFERVKVDGISMMDTLLDGQHLIAYKLGYFFHAPQKGDIVVIIHQEGKYKGNLKYFIPVPVPDEIDYIKRVIALPGDTVDIHDGHVFVNGKQLDEPYAKGTTNEKSILKYPVTIENNKVFVLGDNREHSSDSREFGPVDFSMVKGKAIYRISPWEYFGSLYK